MKPTWQTCCLALLISFPATAQPAEDDWKKLQLRGKVKSLVVKETHRYKNQGVFTPWAKGHEQHYRFNAAGRKTEYLNYEESGELGYRADYSYDAKRIEEKFSDKNGTLTARSIYSLDPKGQIVEEAQYRPDGSLTVKYLFTYDDRGRLVERKGFKADGSISGTATWKYDERGNQVERFDGFFRFVSVYDASGLKTGETMYKQDGSVMLRWTYRYDEKGNKIEEVKYDGRDQVRDQNAWRHEYDKKGNWLKRVQSGTGGEDIFIEERTITYY